MLENLLNQICQKWIKECMGLAEVLKDPVANKWLDTGPSVTVSIALSREKLEKNGAYLLQQLCQNTLCTCAKLFGTSVHILPTLTVHINTGDDVLLTLNAKVQL